MKLGIKKYIQHRHLDSMSVAIKDLPANEEDLLSYHQAMLLFV